jgi:hypothetical protein
VGRNPSQVERHGEYSIERMYQLKHYSESTSLLRSWVILLVTPLPCIVGFVLLDCVLLQPPSAGLQ